MGIIPTDTKYAFVADLESRDAVQRLYDLKRAGSSKPMSILCRGFSDIDRYTQGFPDNVVAGPSIRTPRLFALNFALNLRRV